MRKYLLKRAFLGASLLFFNACSSVTSPQQAENIPPTYLRAQMSERDLNLDPSAIWEVMTIEIFNILFDTLYSMDEKGNIIPSLAKDFPEISEDGLTYKIRLRTDAFFHDDACFRGGKGRAFNAEDVVYSFKRIADPKNTSGLWSLLKGRVQGFDAYRKALEDKKGKFSDSISGLRALSPHELEIKLVSPYRQFFYILTIPSLSIVPHEAIEKYKKGFSKKPVGTGPYDLISYDSSEIIVKRIPSHWRFPPHNLSAPEGISFHFYEDAWDAFKNGKLDVHYIPTERLKAYVDASYKLKEDIQKQGYKLFSNFSPDSLFLIFNYHNSILQNIHLRRAIAYAVDWKKMIGHEDLSSASIIPRGIPGFMPLHFEQNIAQAKQELVLAGYPQGKGLPELTLEFHWQPRLFQAGLLQDDLEKLGIKLRLEFKDQEMGEIENADLGFQGWVLDYPDADSILSLLTSSNFPPVGRNYGYYQDKIYDDMFEKASRFDASERAGLYQKMNQRIFDQIAVIPFRQVVDYYAISPRVESIEADLLEYIRWTHIQLKKGEEK